MVKGFLVAVMGSVANVGAVAGSEEIVCRKVLHVGRLSRWDNAIVAEHAAFVAAGPVVSVLLMGSCVECVKNMKERRCGMSTHEHWLVCALFISCCSRRPS